MIFAQLALATLVSATPIVLQARADGDSYVTYHIRESFVNYINRGGKVVGAGNGATNEAEGSIKYPATAKKDGDKIEIQGKGSAQLLKYCTDKTFQDETSCILNSRYNDPKVVFNTANPDQSQVIFTLIYGLATAGPGNQQGPFTVPLADLKVSKVQPTTEGSNTVYKKVPTELLGDQKVVFDGNYPEGDTIGFIDFSFPTSILGGGDDTSSAPPTSSPAEPPTSSPAEPPTSSPAQPPTSSPAQPTTSSPAEPTKAPVEPTKPSDSVAPIGAAGMTGAGLALLLPVAQMLL